MAGRMQKRRGTAAQWAATNPVLAAAEPGVEVDTGREKNGDGVRAWNDLPYVDTVGLATKADAAATTAALATKADAAATTAALATKADAAATTAALATKVDAAALTANGNLLTRVAGVPGEITRANLAADAAFSSRFASRVDSVVNVKDFGAVGDNSTNDTAAITAAITACPVGGTVFFPDGSYRTTAALSITKTLCLQGEGAYTSQIVPVGVGGVVVASGISSFSIRQLGIARSVRHTVTPNTSIGLQVLGATGARPSNHAYEDVLIDGFQTGIETNWLWSSSFRNVRPINSQVGLFAKGLSVNNMFMHGQVTCDASAGSRGILIGDGTNATEGWIISDSLVYNCEVNVEGVGATHCKLVNSIIDYATVIGVAIRAATTDFGGNWEIIGNYIAMSGTGGDSAINLSNTVNNSQDQGCRVQANLLVVYAGATCGRGIRATGTQSKRHVIAGNTIGREALGFSTWDIDANYSNGIVIANNQCISPIATHIQGGEFLVGNTGQVQYARALQRSNVGLVSHTWDQAIPTTGTWKRGDVCWNVTASAGGTPGWVCVVAGTPGTWRAMANLAP
jgi:hypothetical protein